MSDRDQLMSAIAAGSGRLRKTAGPEKIGTPRGLSGRVLD